MFRRNKQEFDLLEVQGLSYRNKNRVLYDNLTFEVEQGDIFFIRGPIGVGKSLLLRQIAQLEPVRIGDIFLRGVKPEEKGQPAWRAEVSYFPDTFPQLQGTPSEFYIQCQNFRTQRVRPRRDLTQLLSDLGADQAVLNQPWETLQETEARVALLALYLSLQPSVLLLDDPTRNLDLPRRQRIERVISDNVRTRGLTVLWATRESVQPARVGGRVLDLPLGIQYNVARPPSADVGVLPLRTAHPRRGRVEWTGQQRGGNNGQAHT